MEVKLQVIFFICGLLAVISAKNVKSKPGTLDDYGEFIDENTEVQNDDYYDGTDESDHNTTPDENNDTVKIAEFRTKSMAFTGRIGETILLPCETSDPEVVLAWYKDDKTFLFQAGAAITHYPNMNMYPNGTLAISLTSETDFGKFSCKMLLQNNQPEIVHVINTPPKIISITTADNSKVYRVGDTLNLTCLATGYPKPKITWHKGSESIGGEGGTLTIPDLKFKNAGIYRCLADNNIISPAHSHIEINIEHKPVVSIEKYMVNSDTEHDTELKCTVHAYPAPYVAWKKNGTNIIENAPKVVLKKHFDNVENILIIRNLTDEDFAQYTCSAKNKLGKVEKSVKLVKTPVVQGFVKPEKANREVELTWKIDSKSPISKHQLQYRKKNEVVWKELDPEVSHENGVYTLKSTLKDLDAGSYETRVRSQNVHGWSDYSQIMPFEGVLAKNGLHHKPHNKKHQKEKDTREKQTTTATPPLHRNIDRDDESVSESVKAGCAAVASSVSLICIALLTIFFNRQ